MAAAMASSSKKPDVENLCRVCLSAKADLFSLYNEPAPEQNFNPFAVTATMAEILTECTRHKVDRFDDRLPHQICAECIEAARAAHCFKRQVERSYRQLMDWLRADNEDDCGDANTNDPNVPLPKLGQREMWTQTEKLSLHPCEMCNNKFFDAMELRQHRKQAHRDAAKKCKVCALVFKDVRALKAHLALEHPHELPTTEIQCPICKKKFSRSDHMKRHMRNIHKMGGIYGEHISLKTETGDEIKLPSANDLTHFLVCADESESEADEADATNPISSDDDEKYNVQDFLHLDIKVEPLEMNASGSKLPLDVVTTEMLNVHFDMENDKKPPKKETDCFVDYENDSDSSSGGDDDFEQTRDDDDDSADGGASEAEDGNEKPPKRKFSKVKNFGVGNDDDLSSPPRRKVKIERIEGGAGVGREKGASGVPKATRIRRRKGENEENRCALCQRTFKRYCHLKRHMATHSQEKPYACDVCAKRFTRSDHLRKHIDGVHGTKEHKCDVCALQLGSNSEVLKHKVKEHGADPNANKNFECEFCLKRFGTLKYLGKHRLLHTDRVFACRHCDETFQDRKVFREHEKTHSKEQRNFLCSICGDSFQRNEYLKIHMRRHTGEKPYKCKFCGKGFPRATDLNQHERYHTGHKPNVCTLCGKAFHRAYNLTIHMRTHTGERPHKCDQCPKSFAQGNDLKAHIRRHTGERYKCTECDAGFLQLYAMRQHALSAHGVEIEPKTGRLQKFPTRMVEEAPQNLPPPPPHQQQQLTLQHTASSAHVGGIPATLLPAQLLPAQLLPAQLQPLIANYMLPSTLPVIHEMSPQSSSSHGGMPSYKSV